MLPTAEVTATDLNPAMVSWAAERTHGARWLQADAQAIPLPNDSFDLVACEFGVMFFPDKAAAFAEMARVLVPRGTVLFSVWDSVETSLFPSALVASLQALFPHDPPSFIVRVPHGYADPAQIKADLGTAGFGVPEIERLVLRGRAPSARTLAEGFCLGTPLRFALEERGPLGELTEAVAEQMTILLGSGPVEGDLAAFIVTASPNSPSPDSANRDPAP